MKQKLTLKQWRKSLHLTQAEAGKLIGVGATTICAWETGKTTVTITKLKKIMEAYGIEDLSQIEGGENKFWNAHKPK